MKICAQLFINENRENVSNIQHTYLNVKQSEAKETFLVFHKRSAIIIYGQITVIVASIIPKKSKSHSQQLNAAFIKFVINQQTK